MVLCFSDEAELTNEGLTDTSADEARGACWNGQMGALWGGAFLLSLKQQFCVLPIHELKVPDNILHGQ